MSKTRCKWRKPERERMLNCWLRHWQPGIIFVYVVRFLLMMQKWMKQGKADTDSIVVLFVCPVHLWQYNSDILWIYPKCGSDAICSTRGTAKCANVQNYYFYARWNQIVIPALNLYFWKSNLDVRLILSKSFFSNRKKNPIWQGATSLI